MVRMRGTLLALIAALPAAPLLVGNPPPHEFRVLDERRIDYREQADRRVVADVRVRLVRDPRGTTLEIVASAVGPFVEPAPGYEGLRGANRITAEHLRAIGASGRLKIETRTGSTSLAGTIRTGRWGPVRERRTGPAGPIDLAEGGAASLPLELVLLSGHVGDGPHKTTVSLDGVTRLRVLFVTSADRGRIVSLSQQGSAP